MARKGDTRIGLWMLGAFLLGFAVGFDIFWILPGSGVLGLVLSVVGGLLIGFLAMMIIFGRRAQAAAFNQMNGQPGAAARSEEQTSELQSLMRISYAVFCLKKKTTVPLQSYFYNCSQESATH